MKIVKSKKNETVSKVFICHKDTKAQREVKLKIKSLRLGVFVASFQKLTFETTSLIRFNDY